MVFSSLDFLFLFLPAFAFIYYLFTGRVAKNVILVSGSLIFYGWENPISVLFLVGSAVIDYWNGRWIERFRDSRLKILGLISTLVFNLGMLGVFKYSGFFIQTVNDLFHIHVSMMKVALPIGMSFYTFETISYTIDVYRGKSSAQRSLLNFMVFMASFPRLVAGPIVRYWQVEHELAERTVRLVDLSSGITRFCRGLFKKVFFANVAGALTERYLDGPLADMTVFGAWFGLCMFTLQIYFDFSGYSDMAIGLGRMLGFALPENFRHPYIADSITEFWRRWHITMSNFFRDYVYIPLGGNRKGGLYQVRNVALVWAVTGLWHGASWNFVIWGVYFGVLVLLEKWFLLRLLGRVPRVLRHVYALSLIVWGWLIFHTIDLGRLRETAKLMVGATGASAFDYDLISAVQTNVSWIMVAVVFCMPVRAWAVAGLRERVPLVVRENGEALLNFSFLIASTAMLVGSSYNPFIYFRF